ncbi:MAG: peptide deformylase [Candidatus Saccharimonadales bacterium]
MALVSLAHNNSRMSSNHEIISVPDSRLRQTSRKVSIINQDTLDIIERMKKSTLDWEANRKSEVGVALAAIQIGELERIIIVRAKPEDKDNTEFEVFINPEITKLEGDIITEPEGCLSVPDIYANVPRHDIARIKALDINGNPVRSKSKGFLARVFQHEIDHLRGKLFVDHVKDQEYYKILDDGAFQPLQQEQIDEASVLWRC